MGGAFHGIGVMPAPLEDTSSLRSKLVTSEAEASERARRQELMCLYVSRGKGGSGISISQILDDSKGWVSRISSEVTFS